MTEPMTSQSAFSFPDPNTQLETFTSFSPSQTFTSKPITNSQPNPQTSNTFQNPQFQQYHTATLSIIQNRNSKKSLGRDSKGGIIILPPVSFEEHVAVQRETKARTLLLQSLLEDHMVDFYHLDDAREIWLAVKARFGGNEESKKMRKTMLKQEFSDFRVSEEEGLHKGYDRFQKILSQLNQMQAKPDNDDLNLKFLRALPPSWSQVALTLKTRGGLEYPSFDDLYNKLRSLEIDVKGGSSYGSRGTVAPTHSAFIGATSTTTKIGYSDPPSHSSSITYTSAPSGSLMEDVLQSFVAENEPIQQLVYEDFEQVNQMDMEELDIKWQMAMLSLRINKFQKKAGRKINFNNKNSARFDRRKARCYNYLQLGHFARECNVKKVDEKARYSAFKISEVKTKEPKAMSDFADPAVNAVGSVYDAAAEFAMMGISPKVFDLSIPSIFDPEPVTREVKSLYERFVKAGDMHEVPPCITGTFMPTSSNSKLEETHVTFGLKSPTSINTSESNDFVSCDNSDKSSESETHDFASCVSSPTTTDSFSTVDVKILPKSGVTDPSPLNGVSSCSIKENVHPHVNKDIGIVDSGFSRSMTCNKEKLADFVQVKGGTVTFGGGDGKITGKGTIRTSKLDFENVYYVEELQNFNLFSVSQIYDKKNKVLFIDAECLVLSKEFQLPDESQVVLRIPRMHDLYTFNLSDIQSEQHINCLLAKASLEESTKWHM
nr:ribonuclease H-like domain-containing protein [Tanacetum cinerariifolium]